MGIISSIFSESTKEIPAVCNVDLERYLGMWYEIARLPHTFEKGLDNVTATYNLKSDGKIEVINSGLKKGEKSVAKAVAWVPEKTCTGQLLVSFFKPIKSEYRIIKLDEEDYSYSVVTGGSKNFLWILSRNPEIRGDLYNELLEFVSSKGYDIAKIIKVDQSDNIINNE